MISPEQFDRQQHDYWTSRTNLRSCDQPVVRAFATQRVRFLERLFADWRPARALEVGCGDGFGMRHMQGLADTIYGCDLSPAMLKANPASRRRLVRADAYAAPFQNGSFDLVYCWELLHHVGRPEAVVAEMRRVSGRCVLICEPNCLNPAMAAFGLWKREERGLLRFNPWFTKNLLEGAGLRDVRLFSVGCFTPNQTPLWLARLLMKLPYRWPLIGLYNIALGYVPSEAVAMPLRRAA
jgi:SAM-dependent methyltransferase